MISRGEGRAVALSMVLRNHNPAWQLQRVSRQKRKFANRPLCGRLSVGKGISSLRWLVVAPMCPAYLRGFA